MKPLRIAHLVFITLFSIFLISCSSNDEDLDEIENNTANNLEENTVNSTTTKGNLNYFTIVDIGNYFQISVSENSPNLQNPSFGVKVDLMIKNSPTQTTIFNHRVAPDFNLETEEYFLYLKSQNIELEPGESETIIIDIDIPFSTLKMPKCLKVSYS